MANGDTTSNFSSVLNAFLSQLLAGKSQQDSLPIAETALLDPLFLHDETVLDTAGEGPAEPVHVAPPVKPHFELVGLNDDDSWSRFSRRFTDRTGNPNLNPWFRCLGVLRGLGAQSAVIEEHYVCLDYRSEFAAFYAHLDRPQRHATIRVHFFSDSLADTDILNLNYDQQRSYLGYIVCRQGDMPLVGRTIIKTPDYIDTSTAILEPVNFYAQRLAVKGVPFMQQDERFAVCAHVAVWIAHYSAYRRRLFERKLIADFVSLSRRPMPMRSKMAEGLTPTEAMTVLDLMGFRTHLISGPLLDRYGASVRANEIPTLARRLDIDVDDPNADIGQRIYDDFANWLADGVPDASQEATDGSEITDGDSDDQSDSQLVDPIHNMDILLDYLLGPYIDSGWPIYGVTQDHAVSICGKSDGGSSALYFLHDDQLGPYLVADSLSSLSLGFLHKQSGRFETDGHPRDCPPIDWMVEASDGTEMNGLSFRAMVEADSEDFNDLERALYGFAIPLPARLHLQASRARRDAIDVVETLMSSGLIEMANDNQRAAMEESEVTATILEGIRFKRSRRNEAFKKSDEHSVAAYAAAHLAEWVVVIEGVDSDNNSLWEIVYDGSSSDRKPRAQLLRFLETIYVVRPTVPVEFECSEGFVDRYKRIDPDNFESVLKNETATGD